MSIVPPRHTRGKRIMNLAAHPLVLAAEAEVDHPQRAFPNFSEHFTWNIFRGRRNHEQRKNMIAPTMSSLRIRQSSRPILQDSLTALKISARHGALESLDEFLQFLCGADALV